MQLSLSWRLVESYAEQAPGSAEQQVGRQRVANPIHPSAGVSWLEIHLIPDSLPSPPSPFLVCCFRLLGGRGLASWMPPSTRSSSPLLPPTAQPSRIRWPACRASRHSARLSQPQPHPIHSPQLPLRPPPALRSPSPRPRTKVPLRVCCRLSGCWSVPVPPHECTSRPGPELRSCWASHRHSSPRTRGAGVCIGGTEWVVPACTHVILCSLARDYGLDERSFLLPAGIWGSLWQPSGRRLGGYRSNGMKACTPGMRLCAVPLRSRTPRALLCTWSC
jgi:hypothetical protein